MMKTDEKEDRRQVGYSWQRNLYKDVSGAAGVPHKREGALNGSFGVSVSESFREMLIFIKAKRDVRQTGDDWIALKQHLILGKLLII